MRERERDERRETREKRREKKNDEERTEMAEEELDKLESRTLPQWLYSFKTNEWVCRENTNDTATLEQQPPSSSRNTIKLICYNVWMENFCHEERWTQIFRMFEEKDPDVICVQEATTKFLSMARQCDYLQRNGFVFSDIDGQTFDDPDWFVVVVVVVDGGH
eukprot:TRINITY_DN1699_c0_g2_i1.p1 TRINITY_DN1699_c0_g2~~TRINITY_DN1699_c0_g2_i1.p1  ORF type:complete len:175 (-),score=58.84 TRINITY_DN1699_c0_g2_i1:841-1326(-)